MIYFTGEEIFFSVFLSFVSGIFFGAVYSSIGEIISYLILFLKGFPYSIKNCSHISFKRIKKQFLNKNKINGLAGNLSDFLYFTVFGCVLILITYRTLDGVLRSFIPITAFFAFILANITVGKAFSIIINKILSVTAIIYVCALNLILHYPVTALLIFYNYQKKLATRFNKAYTASRSRKLIKRKLEEIKGMIG